MQSPHPSAEVPPRAARLVPQRWLILSHAFNMDGRAASQTITDKIPYLVARGIEPTVISAVTGMRDRGIPHAQVLPWGPAALRFDFRHWLANRCGRGAVYRVLTTLVTLVLAPFIIVERLALGLSSQWSWAVPVALRGRRMVKAGAVDLVYSTGGEWSAHLAGWWIKKTTGVPWIAEIHDPLVSPDDAGEPREAAMKAWLERKICADADLVWWFTDNALARARERNPQLGERGFAVLAGAAGPAVKATHSYGDTLTIGHFGSLMSRRSLAPFLEALADFCAQNAQARARIRVHVYGSALDAEAARTAKARDIEDMIVAHGRIEKDPVSGRSGRDQILIHMQTSDVLLLLHGSGPECAEYIPSKLFEYLWARRPVFALTADNPQLDALIRERGGYCSHTLDRATTVANLARLWQDWQKRALADGKAAPVGVEETVATIFGQVERVCARRARAPEAT